MTRQWVKTVDERQVGRHGLEVWRNDYLGVSLRRTEKPKVEKLGRAVITCPDKDIVCFEGALHSADTEFLTFSSLANLTEHIKAVEHLKTFWEQQLERDREEKEARNNGR